MFGGAEGARRVREHYARVEEFLDHPLRCATLHDLGGGGRDYGAHPVGNFEPALLEHGVCRGQVLVTAVGAAPYVNLIDFRAGYLTHRLHVVGRVGARGHRFEFRNVVLQHRNIRRVRVGLYRLHTLANFGARPLGEPFEHRPVGQNEPYLSAHLGDHRAEGDALGQCAAFDGAAAELHGQKVEAARPEVAHDFGQQVAHGYPAGELAADLDFHRLGHAEPVRAVEPRCRDVGVADAGRERRHGTQKVHVAVGAQYHVTRFDYAVLEHHVLTDAVIDVVYVRDALAFRELPDYLLVVRHFLRVGGRLKVEGERDFVRIPDVPLIGYLVELQRAVRAAEIARGRPVYVAPDAFAHMDLLMGGPFHYLHDHRLAHANSSNPQITFFTSFRGNS